MLPKKKYVKFHEEEKYLERSDTDYLKYYSNNRYEEMTKPRRHLN
jgi:hypothetical protein